MAHVLAATPALSFFRDRDLFIHDGTKLRRFRLSAPVQAIFFVVMMGLIAWSGYAAARLVTGEPAVLSLSDATEARAQKIEQRQALIEAILTGQKVDEAAVAAASAGLDAAGAGPYRREGTQRRSGVIAGRSTFATDHAPNEKPPTARRWRVGGPFEASAGPTRR